MLMCVMFWCCHDNHRLYNALPEVQQKKEVELRQQRNATNRERARQFHQVGKSPYCIDHMYTVYRNCDKTRPEGNKENRVVFHQILIAIYKTRIFHCT